MFVSPSSRLPSLLLQLLSQTKEEKSLTFSYISDSLSSSFSSFPCVSSLSVSLSLCHSFLFPLWKCLKMSLEKRTTLCLPWTQPSPLSNQWDLNGGDEDEGESRRWLYGQCNKSCKWRAALFSSSDFLMVSFSHSQLWLEKFFPLSLYSLSLILSSYCMLCILHPLFCKFFFLLV